MKICFRFYFSCIFLFFCPVVSAEPLEILIPVLSEKTSTVSDENVKKAGQLFDDAIAAAKEKKRAETARLLLQVLDLHPDNKEIRTLLGWHFDNGDWKTLWEIDMLKRNSVNHPVFGYLPAANVARYEKGERFVPKFGWISKADEALLRSDIRNGWEITTEHYNLKTSHSLEKGTETARQLEQFYRSWQLLFLGFLLDDSVLQRLADGKVISLAAQRYQVFLYRDKQDYIACLQGIEPRIALSNGYYFTKTKRAYFFPPSDDMEEFDAETVRKTIFHEGTHQLFQENHFAPKLIPGMRQNFFLVEGIAMFAETFRIEERNGKNYFVFGDRDNDRLAAAKHHLLNEKFYVPFGNLVRMSGEDFQSHPKLAKLYSQAAAMTHFLMFADNGKYRESTVQLLRLIYAGQDKQDSLSTLTGKSYEELDKDYIEFMKAF